MFFRSKNKSIDFRQALAALAENGSQTDEVSILPDNTVRMGVHQVNGIDGSFYLPQSPVRKDVLMFLVGSATGKPGVWGLESKRGGLGRVYLAGDLAIKAFFDNESPAESGLPALEVNIGLKEGLERVDHVDGWVFKAPTVLGAYLPNGKGKPTWVMTRGVGSVPRHNIFQDMVDADDNVVLRMGVRSRVFMDAFEATGIPGAHVWLDDKDVNSVVQFAGKELPADQPSILTKFDVSAITYSPSYV